MATFHADGWTLDNAEQRHAEAPATFHIPDRTERTSLRVGQKVQLLFLFLNEQPDGTEVVDCEKMWVTILEVRSGRYRGQLESLPHTSTALVPLDEIRFGPEHVAAVLIPKTDPRHPHYRANE